MNTNKHIGPTRTELSTLGSGLWDATKWTVKGGRGLSRCSHTHTHTHTYTHIHTHIYIYKHTYYVDTNNRTRPLPTCLYWPRNDPFENKHVEGGINEDLFRTSVGVLISFMIMLGYYDWNPHYIPNDPQWTRTTVRDPRLRVLIDPEMTHLRMKMLRGESIKTCSEPRKGC